MIKEDVSYVSPIEEVVLIFDRRKSDPNQKTEQVLTSYTSFLSLTFSYYLFLIGQIWREIQKTKKVGPEKAQK